MGFHKVQALMQTGVLATPEAQQCLHAAACKILQPPPCAACQFGKQRSQTIPGRQTTANLENNDNRQFLEGRQQPSPADKVHSRMTNFSLVSRLQ